MAESRLRKLLHDLDVELQKASGLEEKQRQQIAAICREVEALLAEMGSQQDQGLKDRLEEALALFETSHPNLTLILEQLIDTLAGMGL